MKTIQLLSKPYPVYANKNMNLFARVGKKTMNVVNGDTFWCANCKVEDEHALQLVFFTVTTIITISKTSTGLTLHTKFSYIEDGTVDNQWQECVEELNDRCKRNDEGYKIIV